MSKPHDEPPAYNAGPQQPQASYQGGYPQNQQQVGPYGQGPYGPPANGSYYQSNPNMGYYQQQGPPQGGYYQQQQQGPYGYQQGGYYGQPGYPPQGRYQNQSHKPGCLEGILAGLAVCCCLDFLF
ncbi:hypothetical protein JX265_003445 [Neoarthrinium moseri]|uniref:Cysteine-rich transmembrane domain-containing protein n=1 Tax=Neoarthrinium moseri TaxID=1658444 RepID=A0A9P9WRV4_9PEZI|nr:uncharacterized protein JN550_002194 [Neoarthrinium moseri]KAI1850072.1 hypothetical protein JX266_004451 [Neoarthrinium moseri]KAI1874765.1 hypothetical protein JN550_002194 [Neoarthrinium moseri]KAI1877437.1 hypothetical protein JX265_003445 [Neoarthrinium moseri]